MTRTKSKADIQRIEKDAMLHGRKGLISQSLEEYNCSLSKKERAEKYTKMALSPYSFYRGSNHIFWQDFEWDWRMTRFGNYRTRTWLIGDCHAYNFGAYEAHKVGVVYGLNDFDESIIADYQYDLWRLAISLVLICNEPVLPKKSPLRSVRINKVIDTLSMSYLQALFSFAGNKKADETCYTAKNTENPLKKFLKKTGKKDGRKALLEEWIKTVDGKVKFNRENPDVGEISSKIYRNIIEAMPAYIKTIEGDQNFSKSYFNVQDIVVRLNAGTGSLGSDRYYVLIEADKKLRDDDVILDIKEEQKPSAFPYATLAQQAEYLEAFPNEGIRYTTACRALDYHPDDHLGWMKLGNKYFGVRERDPFKKSFKVDKDIKTPDDYLAMAKSWGKILATEHARAEKVNHYSLGKEVKKLVKGNTKEFKKTVRETAIGYAKVVKADYKLFVEYIAPKP